MTQPIICPVCGARMRGNREWCLRCDSPLPASVEKKQDSGRRRVVSRRTVLAVAASAAIVVVGLVGVNLLLGNNSVTAQPLTRAPLMRPLVPQSPEQPVRRSRYEPVPEPRQLARLSFEAENYEAAFAQYRAATERDPRDAESLSNAGQCLIRLGRVGEAVPYFERAIWLNDSRWAYHFNLAHANGELGRWDKAIDEYQKAAALFPDDFPTEYNLGMALHKHGQEEAAVEHFQRAIQLQGSEADFHLALAISLERLDRKAEAVKAYGDYLALARPSPTVPKVQAHMAALTAGRSQVGGS